VVLPAVPAGAITGEDLPAAKRLAPAIGLANVAWPARWNYSPLMTSTAPFWKVSRIRFAGSSGSHHLLLAQGDPAGGRAALAALELLRPCDLFMTPTARACDIVLPVASCFEREASRSD